MQFIDKVQLKLKAGNGGNGIVAFKHEKYNPLGGPSGGDGGDGGSIIFVADSNKSTLLDLKYSKTIKAEDGANGKTNSMHGAAAEDVIVKVPMGTLIKDLKTNTILADLSENGKEEVICKGGKGGKGNHHFATGRNSAPEFSKLGETGEVKDVEIELKLLADVGLVGFPSVGKSTLLSIISSAKPEIADYPFTTLKPQLGMVKIGNDSFVVADLPGLIEGASQGKGLGHDFLKHIERCRLIFHIVDMSGYERDPISDYEIINNELKEYPGKLDLRPQIVIANKMDMEGSKENLKRFKEKYKDIKVFEASFIKHENIDSFLYEANTLLKTLPIFPLYNKDEESNKVVYKYEKTKDFEVIKEKDGVYRIEGDKIERLLDQTNLKDDDSLLYFQRTINKMKIDDALKKAGCKPGDKVFIKEFSFAFID